MTHRSKKKLISKIKSVSTEEELSKTNLNSENIVRLKLTVRKGAHIESVPLKR